MFNSITSKSYFSHLALVIVLLLSFGVRLYKFDRPLADWHSWRQADTASVTREYVKNGIDLLRPEYHDLSNIPSGYENPQGYRMVEFPLVNATVAFIYQLFGLDWEIHIFSRLINIIISLVSVVLVYLLLKNLTTSKAAWLGALVFGLLPFNVFYSTTVLPEVSLVMFSLLSIFAWVRYVDTQKFYWLVLTVVAGALALLLKPIFVFYGPAMLYYLVYRQGFKSLTNWKLYLAFILGILPLVAWRGWITQFPEGIPAAQWLLNSDGIRFKGAFFRWLFAQRIGELILGYWGLIAFGFGLILKPNTRSGWFFHFWFLGILAYLSIFATGNVTHDYYQVFILPIIAIFVALGLERLFFGPYHQISRLMSKAMALVIFGFMMAFSWFAVRGYFNINNYSIVEAGRVVDQLVPVDALVIAPLMGDTAFLYQTNRRGWPIGFNIPLRLEQGATHYVSTSYDDEARALEQQCDLVVKTDQYIIIDLTECQFEPNDQGE